MNTLEIDKVMEALKPDGIGCNRLATELHKLANSLQEQTDRAHAVLAAVRSPEFKGDVLGELALWPGHFPLELDHTEGCLNDIFVRGVSVVEFLAAGLWEEAAEYAHERYGAEPSPGTRKRVARMDAADRRAELAA